MGARAAKVILDTNFIFGSRSVAWTDSRVFNILVCDWVASQSLTTRVARRPRGRMYRHNLSTEPFDVGVLSVGAADPLG